MRHILLAAEVVGATLLMLAIATPPACAQTLGDVTAATGIHSTLARQGVSRTRSMPDAVNRRPATSTQQTPGDGGAGAGVGSWVAGSSAGRGNASSAWLQGGSGWATGGAAGARAPGNRRPRS